MATQEVIEGWRGMMVACGLGDPKGRFICATLATGIITFALKYPRNAFNSDGSIRPLSTTGRSYFLIPLSVGAAAATLV